ncbi:MAG: asparagine synthase (glutamine-hydrolyzing), partial [Anaerolineaceae bacterium]|nr:asparagine synthase (glutamine-hydrolyzing) [Anaerolineaceae bacterium]
MCGLAGILGSISADQAVSLGATLLDVLQHRGPDDLGWLQLAGQGVNRGRGPVNAVACRALLIHRRLSILDLSEAGSQPMSTPDGRYHLVFNGEIYNYLELRQQLEQQGCTFRSHGDAEVLLQAIARWGPEALNRLVGMFAFAVLDTQRRRVLLARDAFGIKPLFWCRWQGGLAFASEIKALLELPGVTRCVNPQPLYDYLRYGYTDHGPATLFAGIHNLPPAHYMEISLDDLQPQEPQRFWQLDLDRQSDLSFDEAAAELRRLFIDSVRLHLRSDVPVGAALSGGIDSSAIVMAMRELQGRRLELHTFSYIADDESLSEQKWIDLVGRESQAVVHKVQPTSSEMVADLDRLISVQDEPFGSASIYAQYRVFRLAGEVGIKVMLDGQGADELLAGYRYFLAVRLVSLLRRGRLVRAGRFLQRASRLPGVSSARLMMNAAGMALPGGMQAFGRRCVGQELMPDWLNASWFADHGARPRSFWQELPRQDLRQHLLQSLTQTSLPGLLRYEDRNAMAYSIESR